jgi:hypothetical protein
MERRNNKNRAHTEFLDKKIVIYFDNDNPYLFNSLKKILINETRVDDGLLSLFLFSPVFGRSTPSQRFLSMDGNILSRPVGSAGHYGVHGVLENTSSSGIAKKGTL